MDVKKFNADYFEEIGSTWALVTAGNAEKSNTMTVGWGGVGALWGKKVTFVFIRKSRYTKEFIDNGESFSVAFLGEEYRNALKFCGAESGRNHDKWKESGLTPSMKDGVVYPAEAELAILCRKIAAVPVDKESFIDPEIYPKWYPDDDMHVMYVGEIIDVISNCDDNR